MPPVTTIEEWKVDAYAGNVTHLAQQMTHKTMGTTMVEDGTPGKRLGFDRIAAAEGVEGPRSRFAATPNIETEETRRWANPVQWVFAKMIDDWDKIEQIHMPENEYAKVAAASKNRFRDKLTIGYDALGTGNFADLRGGALGLADQGEEVLSQVALPATQIIPDGGTGLTKAKIVRAHALFLQNEYDAFLHGPRVFVYDPFQLNFLLDDTELTDIERVSIRSLMSGEPAPGLLGFESWIPYTRLPQEGDILRNVAYARAALGVGVWLDEKRRMGERADRSYHNQIFMSQSLGSVRIDDKLVVAVDVDTTAALPV